MKKPMRPTLKRIFNTEQVAQGTCYDVQNYRREIEYTIGVLEGHLVRVERWQRYDTHEELFNREFVELMQELEAKDDE